MKMRLEQREDFQSDVDAVLEKHEHKQLCAALGSLQWLLARMCSCQVNKAIRLFQRRYRLSREDALFQAWFLFEWRFKLILWGLASLCSHWGCYGCARCRDEAGQLYVLCSMLEAGSPKSWHVQHQSITSKSSKFYRSTIDDFPSSTPPFLLDFRLPRLMTPEDIPLIIPLPII